ncbi:hypothetical protein H310_11231 [Aphanomyces invadans]|uniref:Uncharacterized protein n=1 Tax=Aphanomyces invadans TaxID=157072 RepID=A0A024TPS3_9STRA|nr:hypothetical protein H310_11231 [Aphanomyces invadans]ETV95337.1 hypothetical protein H310_11231 [Aphanomyces invadans]|eukprot:XP_008876038.1 hypothetical protein H310_11231 [Aphanomyces invadans]
MAPRMSLFQRFLYVTQTSHRRFHAWVEENMIGLPNPPLTEEEREQKAREQCVDLWTLTWADHVRFLREAWAEYKETFEDDYEVRQAAREKVKHLKETMEEQRAKVDEHLETHHPELKQHITSWTSDIQRGVGETAAKVQEHVEEMKVQAQEVDVERIPEHVGDAVNALKNRPVVDVKRDIEEWALDKLMVGRFTMLAFVEGYKSGKEEELARETPLLKELATKAAEPHKDFLAAKRDEMMRKYTAFEEKSAKQSQSSADSR